MSCSHERARESSLDHKNSCANNAGGLGEGMERCAPTGKGTGGSMTTENGVTVKETDFEVTAHLDGFPVTVKFTGNGRKLKEVIAGLKQSGAVPPPIRSFGGGGFGGKKPDDRTKVAFDEGGREICPLHKKPLSKREWNGSFFWSCPAKAAEGEKASPKGYCDIRFERPA
jgi:hypothetical protein